METLEKDYCKLHFETTPFSDAELKKDYQLVKFKERGYPMAILVDKNSLKSKSLKTNYKFGIKDNSNVYHWFFFGKIAQTNRVDALATYIALLKYCEVNDLGEPFAYKPIQ